MKHFSFYQMIEGVGHTYEHVAAAMFVTLLIVVLSIVGNIALGRGDAAVEPAGKLSIKGIFEVVIEIVNNLIEMLLGKHGRIYLPLFASIFFYILVSNLMGLVPGLMASTSNMNTAFAVGLFSFVAYNFLGLRANGIGYLKHFLGPVWYLAWLMLPIELISHLVRPLSLGLRLSGNMRGDHTVLGIFIDLTKVFIPVIFYGLGFFVCFVQAFVFTLLSIIYVMMATAHDH